MKATNFVRGVPCVCQKRRANFRHASTASAPLLQKNARGSPESSDRRVASSACSGWWNRFDVCSSVDGLLRDRARERRVRVAERGDADAGDQVEIALARVA